MTYKDIQRLSLCSYSNINSLTSNKTFQKIFQIRTYILEFNKTTVQKQ